MYTELNPNGDARACGDARYRLAPGVRARRERFGLLFYNSGDTRLTFLRSGNLLDLTVISGSSRGITVRGQASEQAAKVRRALETLLKKELIVELSSGV